MKRLRQGSSSPAQSTLTDRLRLAGCEMPLIEPPAIEALFQTTQGHATQGQSPYENAALAKEVRHLRAGPGRPEGGTSMNPPKCLLPLPRHHTTTIPMGETRLIPGHWSPHQAFAALEFLWITPQRHLGSLRTAAPRYHRQSNTPLHDPLDDNTVDHDFNVGIPSPERTVCEIPVIASQDMLVI